MNTRTFRRCPSLTWPRRGEARLSWVDRRPQKTTSPSTTAPAWYSSVRLVARFERVFHTKKVVINRRYFVCLAYLRCSHCYVGQFQAGLEFSRGVHVGEGHPRKASSIVTFFRTSITLDLQSRPGGFGCGWGRAQRFREWDNLK